MRARSLRTVLVFLAALAFLPLATDGGQAECCNAAGSLTSTAVGPVNGDESFFKLPTGPANVMFLLDVSGSMAGFPQCGDYDWDQSGGPATCRSPTLTAPANSTNRAVTFTYTGTCTPASFTTPSGATSPLYWMERVTPQATYADPGRSNALLTDSPPWGNGCTGNRCLFDPNAYYLFGDWHADATAAGNYATRRAHDTDAALPAACTALDSLGNPILDYNGARIVLGNDCLTCMQNRGFFFYRLSKYNRVNALNVPDRWTTYATKPIFKGTFLNASPPKFVTARKVVKDVAWMDPNIPSKLDKVRLGLAILDSAAASPRKARLIVPLGPDRTNAYPPSQAGFRQARQYLLSVVNYDQSVYTDGASTIIDGATITNGFFNPISTSTPLASALLNVGQYFTSLNRYNALLGTGFQTTEFDENAAGRANAAWARSNPNQCSICWACQNNSIVVVTDGAPNSEIVFPAAISTYDNTGYNNVANCGGTVTCGGSPLPRVADWLHNQDLRANAVMSGSQKVTVHTVGINMTAPQAVKVLQATANLGGGIFQNANDPQSLGDAVFNAINQVIPKEDSFSASAAQSLQTMQTTALYAFLTRFKPNQTPTWEGHLYETFMFDEHTAGCDAANLTATVTCQGRSVPVDFDGDGKCTGVFMVDADCDEIVENPLTGSFVKKADRTTAANITWDAGQALSDPSRAGYRSADENAANARNIFTWINGAKVALTTANAATLLPHLNITPGWCSAFLTQLGITPTVGQERLTCARQLISFVRGWDTLNQDGDSCWGPGNSKNLAGCPSGTNGEERNRANDGGSTPIFWKLGDIFHSTPVVETAPITKGRCETGFENQCVATIYGSAGFANQTPLATYAGSGGTELDAYDAYRADQQGRRRVVLVGANDGMFHAFDAGQPNGTTDPTGQPQYTNGTGEELWAFVPPDMLPRLRDLTSGHQYMVDGSPMLRDVWVDSGTKDGRKQKDEFHTVVAFGRRSGGTAWTALDVTDPLNPTLLWNFPNTSCGDDARYLGESWSEFAPQPPPIGAVRLESGTEARGFEERWVIMINGGYDPMMNQGRAVFMLDVWTGATLWRYTDADFKASLGFGSGTSMFPVPGGVSMTDIGNPTANTRDGDGFFDTASWGDLGGNLFVARMAEPGRIDPQTNRVSNWPVARAFEQRRETDDSQRVTGRSEFFFMPIQLWDNMSNRMRTFLGSGNRERIMAQSATCGTDNLVGCCQAGCTNVTASSTQNFGACNGTTTFSCVNGVYSYATSTTATCGDTTATCAAPSAGSYNARHTVHWECPGAGAQADAVGTALWDGSGLVTVTPIAEREIKGTFLPQTKSRFYQIWTYGQRRTFDETTAKAFDESRFTDVPYGGTCAGVKTGSCTLVNVTPARWDTSGGGRVFECAGGGTACKATADDPGWFYQYGDHCPLGSCDPAPPWTDEKTGATATGYGKCVMFSSFRPVGSTTSTDPCSGSLGVPAAYDYALNYVSGVPDPENCFSTVAAQQRAITSPPSSALLRVDALVGGSGGAGGGGGGGGGGGSGSGDDGGCLGGGIATSIQHLDPGSAVGKQSLGKKSCAVEPLYWLELSRDEHVCRHVDGTKCK